MYKRKKSRIRQSITQSLENYNDDDFYHHNMSRKTDDGTVTEKPKTLWHFLKKRACSVLLSVVIVIVAIVLWNLEMWHLANVQAANKITFTSDAFHPVNIARFGRP
jgi:hypothetical protein